MTNESIHLDPTMPFAVREKLAAEESAQDANRQKGAVPSATTYPQARPSSFWTTSIKPVRKGSA
jgi:hypothetical protein